MISREGLAKGLGGVALNGCRVEQTFLSASAKADRNVCPTAHREKIPAENARAVVE